MTPSRIQRLSLTHFRNSRAASVQARGDGCIVRLVAITDPSQKFRIDKGEKF